MLTEVSECATRLGQTRSAPICHTLQNLSILATCCKKTQVLQGVVAIILYAPRHKTAEHLWHLRKTSECARGAGAMG